MDDYTDEMFAEDFGALLDALEVALRAARKKLTLYRAAHGSEYVGGMEFTALIHMIDEALHPMIAAQQR
jgi:hypothetical protein